MLMEVEILETFVSLKSLYYKLEFLVFRESRVNKLVIKFMYDRMSYYL